jgi:hypothetical protein
MLLQDSLIIAFGAYLYRHDKVSKAVAYAPEVQPLAVDGPAIAAGAVTGGDR